MKIWVIGRSYPRKNNRLSGSFELEQAKLLADMGNDVCYISCVFHPFRKIQKWGFCRWEENAVHIYAYSQPFFPNRLHIYMDKLQGNIWNKLLRNVEAKEGIPDIIHVHYPTLITVPEAILDYKSKGTKIVVTEHWTAVQNGELNKHEQIQLKKYVSESDYFICVGTPLKESIQKMTHTQRLLHIVPNVVPNYFTCKQKDWGGFRFVAVGRLVPVKQFDHLIKAFWKAFPNEKDVSLTIVGGGSEYNRLKKLIDNLGASKQISLTGMLPRNQTADIISSSDVLVCYSRLETFGVPVIEAWYCGLPVVASQAIGFAEYFDESLGLLIPYNDDNMLGKSLIRIRNQYNQYSKEHIHNFAVDNFSESAVYGKLMEAYNSVRI